MEHVFGNINANGTAESKSSTLLTVVHDDIGEYTLVFQEGIFSDLPACAASQNYPGWHDFTSSGGYTLDNVTIVAISKEKVKLKTGASDGAPADRNFSFIAIGN
ncbi:MAG: hypothetical protein R8P61_17715 [Bacteroidia bacterium]|nr:hypothetical protein [Bacteroidia bacterium]